MGCTPPRYASSSARTRTLAFALVFCFLSFRFQPLDAGAGAERGAIRHGMFREGKQRLGGRERIERYEKKTET